MTSPLMTFAIELVRLWTRLYTWRMDPVLRAARRAEIESDLWELQQDDAQGGIDPAAHVLIVLVSGVPDAVCWRVEHDDFGDRLLRRTVAVIGTAVVIVFAGTWWVLSLMATATLPQPPAKIAFVIAAPPPPPP